jgi:hypothetical protein
VGDVLLALAAGARLSGYVAATVGELGFLRGIWMDAAQRLAWLEDRRLVVPTADQIAGRLAGATASGSSVSFVPGQTGWCWTT